ncbi:MAG TPA: carboxypeptidase regulatory-like domain-containing protein, partial [Pyrinomonadaceae bacterium]
MINPEQLPLNLDLRGRTGGHRRPGRLLAFYLTVPIVLVAGCFNFAGAQTPAPVIVSEPTSTRAIALESLTFMPEPFALVSSHSWSADSRTRIMLFALNLSLQPGENLSSLTAEAEDSAHRNYNLLVEYVGPVPEEQWLSAVVLRLSDDLGDVGDVLVRVSHQGARSNRVRVAIGHKGGGLPDDLGAAPTPAPPYFISGQVMNAGTGLSGVTVKLTGPQTDTFITDASGAYQFTVLTAGTGYTVTVSKSYYDFNPSSQTFAIPGNNQTNINFTATRQAYTIGGHVLDETGQGVDGIQLSITDEAGTTLGTSLTVNGGNYSFTNLAAGFGYTVTPGANNFCTFTPLSTGILTGNLNLDFSGVRRVYSISGRITDGSNGLAGVNVVLSGSPQATATTDSNGNYTLANVKAGRNYTVAPSKTHYVFTPANQAFNNLSGDASADFNGLFRYFISGQVLDNAGRGVAGITVTMAGSQSGATITAGNGSYSFAVAPLGDYAVTPSIEQDWYGFNPPHQSLNNLTTDQTVNFTATLAPIANPSYVLEFDGSPKSVDYGYYWTPGVDLGHFFWEFWAMPGSNAGATYMLTDGYGGAHALLFGFSHMGTSEPGRYQLFGDIYNGITHANFFNSDQGPAPGEWGHFAVGWDGQNITTYFNGVPVGKSAFAGPRRTPGIGGGGSWLLIGGSDHNNLDGRIAEVRGYEVSNPREDPNGLDKTLVESSFAPQTIFSPGGNLLSYYFRPALKIADLSQGYDGKSHAGLSRGTIYGYSDPCSGCPTPKYVIDPTAPNFAAGTAPAPVAVSTPPATPTGARIFDSFSRANSTYVFGGNGGLGATEGGAAGPKVWQTNRNILTPQPFGILNGRAVLLANETCITWIPVGSSSGNLDIRVDRHAGGAGSGLDTGLSFRVLDDRNFFFAYTR